MESPKVVQCTQCDAEIEVPDFRERIRLLCRGCGRTYRLEFSGERQAWLLQPEAPTEPGEEQRRLQDEEAAGAFSVLSEVGRPKREDREETFREQRDIHADEDQAVEKPWQEP